MASPEVVKAEIFAHMAEMRAERKLAMRMAQECASKSGWAFQYDDKCGSSYLHLPAQIRETPTTLGRYRYRFGLQGNLIPGALLQYSLVPPCLHTGVSLHVRAIAFISDTYFNMQRCSLRACASVHPCRMAVGRRTTHMQSFRRKLWLLRLVFVLASPCAARKVTPFVRSDERWRARQHSRRDSCLSLAGGARGCVRTP